MNNSNFHFARINCQVMLTRCDLLLMQEILDKTPANPYEADLLLMAKMVAGEEKPEEEVTKNDSGEDDDTHFADAAAGTLLATF